jgi:S-formylglutathione hydrolase FrmB
VNPLDILAARSFPDTAGAIVAGVDDRVYGPESRRIFEACQTAGMDVRFELLPGGHSWQVWGGGLDHFLPWLATRLELTS